MKSLTLLATMTALCAPIIASAQLVDFEDLNNNGTGGFTLYGDNVTSRGFKFTETVHPGDPQAIASWTSGFPGFYTGTVAIFANYFDGSMTMTKVGGGAFDVLSIDMADVFLGGPNQTVTFVGRRADNTQVTESVRLNPSNVLKTYSLSLMTNIVSMDFQDDPSNTFQFDNINIVPEPATLIGAAVGLAAFLSRKRKA